MSSRVINDNREILKQILLKKASKVTKEYTLAYGQQALWYVYKQNPESSAYNLAYPSRIKSDINIMALRRAFQKLVNRHDSLRTIFCYKDGKLVQTVNGYQQVDFKVQDVKGLREKEVFQRVLKAHRKPFNLETGPLFRVNLFSCDNDYILLISAHHIILDFESFVIINNELWKLYEGEIYGIKEFTNIEDIQYIDFVNNQKNVVESPLNEKHWNYWENKLEGDLSSLSLPLDKKRPPIQTFNGSIRSFTVSKEVTKSLKKYASEEGVTLFVLLQAVYQLFLHRYSGQDDIIIGIPVNGRNQPNFNKIVGYLVNMLPVRVNFKENKTFRQLLQEVRTTITEALKHQDYPFVSLVDRLKIKRDSSRSPIFQATFEYLNYNGHNIKDNQSNLVLCEEYDLPQQEGQFDMILTIEDTGDYLNGKFNYNTDLFNEETIKNMIKHFNILLEGIVDNSNTLISHLPILTDEEINKQLIEYNQTKTEYSLNKCIHTLFEEKAKVAPNSIALVCEDIHMSYDTLNKKANQLARRLRIDGIRKDSIVGIMVNRSVEFIVGILAVLKAGGAYLPIDPTYPNERIKLILEDSGTDILLTMRNIKSVESFEGIKIYLDDKLNYEENNENLDCINKWDNLAYIIYTSGSTGKPKGAMIEHKGVVNYITWAIRQYGNKDGTGLTFPLYSSISFDLTVTSIFTPLLSGNTIIIYGENDFCLDRIVKEDKVDVIKLTPSHLKALIDEDINSKRLKSFIVGGEEFETKVAEEIENKFEQNIIQYNEYGPTETVVGCMIYAYNKNTDKDKAVPIGIGSDNVKLYIFDQYKRLVPDNVIGELYIGGDGVCRGYLNRPDLTSEKFIENPYIKGERIYKTGDLVKRRRDGIIEFIGRVDQQVKIRGYRIECGEIEEYVRKINSIDEAIVVIKEDLNEEKYICSYYVSKEGITGDEIRKELSEKMPHYMIPSKFIKLDKMPINQNGKIDRKLLSNKVIEKESLNNFEEARDILEKDICSIWEKVLNVKDKIGIKDDFFNLGGNSLLAIQVTQKLRKEGYRCKTSDLLQFPTIVQLAEHIKKTNSIKLNYMKEELPQEDIIKEVELTPVQNWFFNNFKDVSQFNQYVVINCKENINTNNLQKAINYIINYHDIIRATFEKKDSKWTQTIEKRKDYNILHIYNLTNYEKGMQEQKIQEVIHEDQKGFNLKEAPLIKTTYFKETGNNGKIVISMHHLIHDFVSFNIIVEDLIIVYKQLEEGEKANLPNKTTTFGEWVNELWIYSQNNDFTEDINYWCKSIKDIPRLNIDSSKYLLNTEESKANDILTLNVDESNNILSSIPNNYNITSYEVILTCIAEAYFKWTGYSNMLIDFKGHGREEINTSIDLTRTVGWFTSMYPTKIELDNTSNSSLEKIKQIKNQVNSVPNKGFNYGVLKYIKKVKAFNEIPKAEIAFNYLGNLDNHINDSIFELNNLQLSSSKNNQLPYALQFNIVILNSQLHIMLTYSKNLFSTDKIKSFTNKVYDEIVIKIRDLCKEPTNNFKICKKCILPNTFPKISIDEDGICNYCKDSNSQIIDDAMDFKDEKDLLESLEKYKNLNNKYDVLVPLSGGVDSSFTLIELVTKYNLKVLGFHNDHGYEDETATNNVRKLCKALDVDLIIKQQDAPFMRKLWKYTNGSKVKGLSTCFVCGGILYANAIEIADMYNIPLIINGYSKGQAMMMANKDTALEFWEEMMEEFQQDEQFFNEFMERQKPMSKQKVYLSRKDLDQSINKDKILVIPFYIFKFNKTDKETLRKKCKEMFDWREMKTSYPGRTTNCDMVWLNTYMDLKRMKYTMYHEEYASLVRNGEISRLQALKDLEFNPPKGMIDQLAKDINLDLN